MKTLFISVALSMMLVSDHQRGNDSLNRGEYEEALSLFESAEREAGPDASAPLLFNLALAALRTHELVRAEAAVEKAAVRGGEEFLPLRDFLWGNAAFDRCLQSEAEALETDAGPIAYEYAIFLAQAARDAWQQAAMSREDWPQARRNVERALLKIDELEQRKKEAVEKKKAKEEQKKPEPPPQDEEGNPDDGEKFEEDKILEAIEGVLSEEEVLTLLEILMAKEVEKRDQRQLRRPEQAQGTERDW